MQISLAMMRDELEDLKRDPKEIQSLEEDGSSTLTEAQTSVKVEEVKFCNNASLFQLVPKKWQICGFEIGPMMIIRNSITSTSRILMVPCKIWNETSASAPIKHNIEADTVLLPFGCAKEKKSFTWTANDYANGQLTQKRFLVRFLNAEVAEQFRVAFVKGIEEAKKASQGPAAVKLDLPSTPTASGEEV